MVNPAKDDEAEALLAKQQKEAVSQEKLIDDFVVAAMTHRQGRDFMWWLMEISQIGRNPFAHNALVTSFHCGEMNVGQQVQARIIRVTPAGYVQMMKEREDGGPSSADGNNAD